MPRVYNRRRGWAQPPADAVYVGRPSKWGNPFPLVREEDRASVLEEYRGWIHDVDNESLRQAARDELRGRDLVCWCAPRACHADVLLEIANGD